MANVLQFALGLSAGNFLSMAGAAKASLAGLLTAGVGLGGVFHGISAQLKRGAGLNDLSARTGETVENLVKLQRGFEITGVSADSVTGIIGALQRSLGGFNEMGEPTKDIFNGIGLSVDALKAKDAPDALNEIFGALRNLNRNDAASAAGKIFGRGNGGSILQAARDGEAFAEAMKDAAQEAAIMARNAAAFDKLDDTFGKLHNRVQTVFASMAQAVAPAMQSLLDQLNGADLAPLQAKFNDIMMGLGESFRQGRFSEVFELSLKSGVQGMSNAMMGEIAKWADAVAGIGAEQNKAGF